MSVHSSRNPLIRISKTGEMRLKNKVGNAILKENAYEERALKSKLDDLRKYRERQDKYMTYRQLEFATKQITASEDRPHATSETSEAREGCLPAINVSERKQRTNISSDSREFGNSSEVAGSKKRSQGKWEKAITFVKLAIQNRERPPEDKTFITQQASVVRRKEKSKESKSEPKRTSLPPLRTAQPELSTVSTAPCDRRPRLKPLSRQISFPDMIKLSREMSTAGLQDPRFLKLTSCLSGEGDVLTTSTRRTVGNCSKNKPMNVLMKYPTDHI